jgi:hypothetical protein
MADLNQGASIEAERAAFEAFAKPQPYWWNGRTYSDLHTQIAWDTWLAARRIPAAATGAGELPPLPEPELHNFGVYAYTAEQYREGQRAAIAADRAQRKQAALQEIIDIGQEIEAGAAPNVKTWQERANELAVSGRPRGYPDTDELEALKDAEIADLRAKVASEQQAKEYEQRHAAESEIALAKAHAQLAAKGQGEPVAKVVRGGSEFGPSLAFIANGKDFPKVGSLLYLAAPASAQPAENPKTVKVLQAALAAALDRDGAQPDQRESAAVPHVPTTDMIRAGMRHFSDKREPATRAMQCYKDMVAAAPSPAAQSVAK